MLMRVIAGLVLVAILLGTAVAGVVVLPGFGNVPGLPLPSGELPVELDAVEEAAGSPGPISARVATSAHLRNGPDITYDQTVTVAAGEMVTVTACSPDCAWYKLDTGDWIVSYLLTDPPGDLPVVVPTFTPTSIPSIAELLPTPTPRVLRTIVSLAQDLPTVTPAPSPTPTLVPTPAGPVANDDALLRGGPGTSYEHVGTVRFGESLEIVSRTRDQKWFQLKNGAWIASWLVDYAPQRLPTSRDLPEAPSDDGSVPAPAWTPFPFTASDPSVIPMGQVTEGKGWRFKVSEAQKRKEICLNDTCVEARGYFLVVLIDVENIQGGTDSFYRNIGPFLIDDSGKEYIDNTDASFLFVRENPEYVDLFANVPPGGSARVVLVFDVPETVGNVMLSTAIPRWVDLVNFAKMGVLDES